MYDMRSLLYITAFFLVFTDTLFSQSINDKLSNRLRNEVQAKLSTNEYIHIGVLLADRVDITVLNQTLKNLRSSPQQRSSTVINALKAKTSQTQGPLISTLRSSDLVIPSSIKSFWVTNLIFVKATSEMILQLAQHEDIEFIDINAEIILDDYVDGPTVGVKKSPGGREPGHDAIKAPQMWAMGYSGYGRKVMSNDTGVDPTHPAISDNYNGNYKSLEQSWFVYGVGAEDPTNCGNHGTHTVGTMLGLDPATNDTIGVAFGARWIGSPGLCGGGSSTDRHIAAFQWAMDPDSNAATSDDMPDVINNSWQDPSTTNECSGIYKSTFDAVEAAGIAIVFSCGNGNGGPDTISNITMPKNINTDTVNVFCVANVNGNDTLLPIATSSSVGPSNCGGAGSLLIKPEVAAPGTNVRSAIFNGSYQLKTGTSMAAPHVSGAIALLKEPFPNLTGSEVKLALYKTCVDLGIPGEDNTYGMGIIDIPAAYNYLVSKGNIPAAYTNDASALDVYNVIETTCDSAVRPVFILENRGSTSLVSVTIDYSYSSGNSDTIKWTGNLAPLDTTHIKLSPNALTVGSYTLSIHVSEPNDQTDERSFNDDINFRFAIPIRANPKAAFHCIAGVAYLTADPPSTGTILWYDSLINGTLLASGNNFNTPILSSDTTYYAEIIDSTSAGKPDSVGGGSYINSSTAYLIFDCYAPFKLYSVKVYAQTAGTRVIELRNSSGGVMDLLSVNIPAGESRVTLDFDLSPGTGYQLRASGTVDLYRNKTGGVFPYILPGILSITTNSFGTNRYYYFYDWEIVYTGPCGRTPVFVKLYPVYTSQQSAVICGSDSILLGGSYQNTTGTYYDSVLSFYGCDSVIGTALTAYPAIAAKYSTNPATYDLSTAGFIQFSDSTVGASTWNWDFGDGNTSTGQYPIHSYSSFENSYLVTLSVSDSLGICFDTISTNLQVISSVGDKIYPNPNTGIFTIDLKLKEATYVKAEVFDVMGRKVGKVWDGTLSSTFLLVDISRYRDGAYILKVEVNGLTIVQKLVKSNPKQ